LLISSQDIKPSNVLVHEDGRIVLTDFELSKEAVNEDVSTTIRSGSRGFMAPEVSDMFLNIHNLNHVGNVLLLD